MSIKLEIQEVHGMRFVHVPDGQFLYGPDKVPTMIEKDYWIGQDLVTEGQYFEFVKATGHPAPPHWKDGEPPAGKLSHPVTHVNVADAEAFCAWLDPRASLPTSQQWERAARGEEGFQYPWGNEWDPTRCRNAEEPNSLWSATAPVGSYPAGDSPVGCHDMAGNVWQWVKDVS